MNERILIVDDNPVNLKLATDVLECDGYVVQQAQDAEEAQEILAGDPPDLILMDIALPGMDGLALTRRLKGDERLKDVPVIALTAFAMKGDDVRALQSGCDGYIAKPIDTRTFASTIAGFLQPRPLR